MSRVKRGVAAHKKHKKLLSQPEGRRASTHKLVRPARGGAVHALRYAYRDPRPTRETGEGESRSRRRRGNSLRSRPAEKPVRVKPDSASTERPPPQGGTRVVPRRPAFVPTNGGLCVVWRRRHGGRKPEGPRGPRGRRDRGGDGRGRARGRPGEVPRP